MGGAFFAKWAALEITEYNDSVSSLYRYMLLTGKHLKDDRIFISYQLYFHETPWCATVMVNALSESRVIT